jgi:hypothetical protein
MMLTDPVVHGWLGSAADAMHRPVPIALFLALTVLGWWLSRRARRDQHQTAVMSK